jgi:hypothetical protein
MTRYEKIERIFWGSLGGGLPIVASRKKIFTSDDRAVCQGVEAWWVLHASKLRSPTWWGRHRWFMRASISSFLDPKFKNRDSYRNSDHAMARCAKCHARVDVMILSWCKCEWGKEIASVFGTREKPAAFQKEGFQK